MRAHLVALVIAVAWNADVEALPVSGSNVALGDGAPGSVAEQAAYGVNLPTPVAYNPSTIKVQSHVVANTLPRVAELAPKEHLYQEPKIKRPGGKEHINRFYRPGHELYTHQQAEKPIYTFEHTMYHIDNGLQMKRDSASQKAVGAFHALNAAREMASTTAEMAYQARSEQEDNLAKSESKIANLRNTIASVAGKDNEDHAKLQLQLERAKQAHASVLAESSQMAKQVDKAMDKSAKIEGLAKADYEANMDGTMELSQAIIAAGAAKMKLEAFDKETSADNRQDGVDKANKAEFSAADSKSLAAVQAVHENGVNAENAANEADYQAAKKQARDAQANEGKGLVTMNAEEAESNRLAAQAAAINVPEVKPEPVKAVEPEKVEEPVYSSAAPAAANQTAAAYNSEAK